MALLTYGRALLVCCCCHHGLLMAASAILGVEPGTEERYSGPDYRCVGFDGSTLTLALDAINDDSCDCADGSDEPGTGACAGQDFTLFFCLNKGSTSRRIYASRVGDGLCDCCDGSDEAMLAKRRPFSVCPDTCAEEGAIARAEGEKKATLLRAALEKQEEIKQAGLKARETWRGEIDQLNVHLKDLQAAFDEAKAAADIERAAEEEKRKAEEAAKKASENATGTVCMWRQTAGCDPSGSREASNDKPCTEFIVAGSSGYCDCDGDGVQGPEDTGYTCEASTGHSCEQVCAKASKAEATEAAPTEESKAEDAEKPQVSEYSKWMDGAAETLSTEEKKEEKQVSEYSKWMEGAEEATGGAEAAADERIGYTDKDGDHIEFAIEHGKLIQYINGVRQVGENPDGGVVTKLTYISGRPADVRNQEGVGSNDYPKELVYQLASMADRAGVQHNLPKDEGADDLDGTPPEASSDPEATEIEHKEVRKARDLESEARSKLDSQKEKITSVQAKLDSIASDDHLVFADLSEKTLSKHISEWDYKIQFFSEAKQDHTSLGSWSKWTGKTTAEFERGTMCWGGPARKLNVKFECALEEEIVDVFEPSRCVYEATVKHPGACDPAELEYLIKGGLILGPKDEL
mmetsp:Transcript_61909/g.112681  ORF Transcript_61909/g.112681 Transcript_61909/m.112681 type:complete len:633 (+) Transcript_61909:94-1992(+)